MDTIALIDAYSLAYRAFHALPPTLSTADGEPTNATFGFTSMLLRVLEEVKPKYMAVAFDVGKTFRHEMYPEYKGTRLAMPDEMKTQTEHIREVVEAFNIPIFAIEGYEADDVLGTLSRKAETQKMPSLIVTGDTDAFQIIDDFVRVMTSRRRFSDVVIYDVDAVKERYGLLPQQLIDYKALVGDKSDNIPGVPGVGDKTARTLLRQYGTLDEIYAHLDEIKSKRARNALEEYRDQAYLSRKLATIVTDLPLDLNLEACRVEDFDRDRVVELFRKLEFRSLINRLPQARYAKGQPGQLSLFQESGRKPLGEYLLVNTPDRLLEMVAHLKDSKEFAFDVETDSLRKQEAALVGMSLSWDEGKAAYIPVGHKTGKQIPWRDIAEAIAPFFADENRRKIAHNAKYDITLLERYGVPVQPNLVDTMIAQWLIRPDSKSLGLKALAFEKLGLEMSPITELIGTGKKQISMERVAIEKALPYAAADADVTLRLSKVLLKELQNLNLERLFYEVEMPLIPVLTAMERKGVLLDADCLHDLARSLRTRLHDLERAIHEDVGYEFNVNSSQQLSEALFDKLNLPSRGLKKTTSGHVTTSADVLERLKGLHPVVAKVLEYRQLKKLLSTYIEPLPHMVNPTTGRVHTSYNQTGAETGRLSSSDPNLQNIPARTDLGREIRKAFVAAPGHLLLGADYSQVELRILAHISGDPTMLAAFAKGADIHAHTASLIFGVPEDRVTKEQRRVAKMTNFAISYGVTGYGLAQRTSLDQETATKFIEAYFRTYPKVKEYIEQTKEFARAHGYVETLLGRRRYFPQLTSKGRVSQNIRLAAERAAINHPIQGTAADIIKIAMIRLHRRLKEEGLRSAMILQVHDELVLEAPEEELEGAAELVKDVMEGAYNLKAPLKVDVERGPNWRDMTPIEPK